MDDLGQRHARQIDETRIAQQFQFLHQQLLQLLVQRQIGAVSHIDAVRAAIPQLLKHLPEQRVLAGEMVVDGALGHARCGGDAVHAGGLVPRRTEFIDRRPHDGLAFAIGQALRRSRHGVA
ncbi:hypothetical protein D3C71_1824090 [compost metagenome]